MRFRGLYTHLSNTQTPWNWLLHIQTFGKGSKLFGVETNPLHQQIFGPRMNWLTNTDHTGHCIVNYTIHVHHIIISSYHYHHIIISLYHQYHTFLIATHWIFCIEDGQQGTSSYVEKNSKKPSPVSLFTREMVKVIPNLFRFRNIGCPTRNDLFLRSCW